MSETQPPLGATPLKRPLCFLDVDYDDARAAARAAAVVIDDVSSAVGRAYAVDVVGVAAYEPGAFFRRELPCLLAVLATVPLVDDAVLVVDGYVVLDEHGKPGLGQHLHEATGRPVIGLAKTSFRGSAFACAVLRGQHAKRPLYVTAVGVAVDVAAATVHALAGKDRLPSVVVQVDHLARGRAAALAPSVRAV